MRIGELASRSGLSTSRIRFYEAEGLLNVVSRRANGYREYPADALTILGIIVGAQRTGFLWMRSGGYCPQTSPVGGLAS
jgi:DNA-binding transcriptional MerR regulator